MIIRLTNLIKEKIKIRNYSIKRQLILSLLIIVLPFILMSITIYRYATNIMIEKISESYLYVMDETANNVIQFLSGIESRTEQVKFDSNVQHILSGNYVDSYEEYQIESNAKIMMETITFSYNHISSIYVVSTQYQLRYMVSTVGFINKEDTKKFPWYKKIDKEQITDSWIPTRLNEEDSALKENVITYVSPVLQLNGLKVIGHILVTFKENSLHKILNNSSLSDYSKIFLLDFSNHVIYSSNRDYSHEIPDELSSEQNRYNKLKGYYISKKPAGNALIIYTTVPNYNWKLISEVPLSEISSKFDNMNKVVYFITLICILISISLAMLLYNGITRPLHDIVIRMENVGKGDFSTLNYSKDTKNEIQEINSNFNNMAENIAHLLERNTNILEQKRDAELAALQSQINPHFLYNTLDAINWLAMLNKQEDISKMVTNLSLFFRTILNKGKDFIKIEDEINHIKAFIDIENFRYKNRFDVIFNLDKRLLGFYTLKFILQPFIENALIHGFKNSNGEGRIHIQLFSQNNDVIFEIIDNGIGMTQERINEILIHKSGSYGIINVNERIKLKFGEKYGVLLKSKEQLGTTATICIPQIKQIDDFTPQA